MAQVQLQRDDQSFDPFITSPVGETKVRLPDDLEAQARSLYGGKYDADAAGDFANRIAQGQTAEQILANTADDYQRRFLKPGAGGGGGQSFGGGLFDDASSSQLEGIARAQMGQVRSNPGLDSLMGFLNKEFSRLSTNPGYSPEDLALLNTQAFEPIEQRRQADQRRVLERTAARGFLPSSGLTEDLSQQADTEANRQRTVAGRELGINAIGQRRADLDRALQIGSLMGLDIPRSQRSEELNLSKLLYQMPRDALQDMLAVINGSPTSSDLFSQSLQTQNQNLQMQRQNDDRNAALMNQIGSILGTLFR
jgi:hypothetical protein